MIKAHDPIALDRRQRDAYGSVCVEHERRGAHSVALFIGIADFELECRPFWNTVIGKLKNAALVRGAVTIRPPRALRL